MIRGILFDKDGTLFRIQSNWAPWIADLIRTTLARTPERGRDLALLMRFDPDLGTFAGDSPVVMEASTRLAPLLLPYLEEDITAAELVIRLDLSAKDLRLAPTTDLRKLTRTLAQRGIKLGLATNDSEEAARDHLAAAGVLDAFCFIAGYDSGHGAKPSAGMPLSFANVINTPPRNIVMVGDSPYDLYAARAAGMIAMGVLSGPSDAALLSGLADVILKDVGELPGWLDRQS